MHTADAWSMQRRYSDGHLVADNTEDNYGAREQWNGYNIANGWLLRWLQHWGRTKVSYQ